MAEREPVHGFGVAVVREDGRWRCDPMDEAVLGDLDAAVGELRAIRSTGAVFGLLAVDDEFFVVVRPSPAGVAVLLSDAAAALDYDLAADAIDLLRAEVPEDTDEVWPAGSLDVLADLGLPAPELQVIVDEVDLYPDEQLAMVAQRVGFGDEFTRVLDRLA
ncbi:tRNA adenosine deaminase-associated protein [Actinokineospora bangkokensis]|uniref:tRNA adenosine deaminase n=1 Tax=Actinokineospora bangkokensis TaxID=1193682 RepID=A0A1Q9LHE8_9PSEU|nr:tRNA adenosine deaminase-associated protein [Actinokineospora bangkokensis]OLR91446.1 tRNA adenosine deaminase [Actinokineospora bangkokensis]